MVPLNTEIAGLEIGDQQTFRNLTIYPIFRKHTPAESLSEYELLDEAIATGTARVTELSEGGSVPELRFENLGNRPVLLLDGQELIGAKQNRVLNLTILAPAKSTIVVPVSCVEAGRWHSVGSEFKPGDHVMYSRVRAARAAQVTDCMRSVGLRRSDQSAVWADIEAKATQLDAPSPTSAMSAIYDRNAMTVEEYTRSFTWKAGQCGIAFQLTSGGAGLDLFDHPDTMRHFFQKLLKSYALDALESPPHEGGNSNGMFEMFAGIASAQSFTEPAVGLGKDVRLNSPGIAGAALWAENRYIHICAFSTRMQSQFSSRVSRPSRRRR
ncbi:MAG TPA: DUF6569 family protein [Candidatus Nanoarchaeia archaeon]|nr:DUF6569 family protein [Candidatus Nanoarchaeia archaeon]